MTVTAAPWQQGHELDELRSLAAVFRASDHAYTLGAFTPFKERDVAIALTAGTLRVAWDGDQPVATAVVRTVNQRGAIRDFTGEVRARMAPGDVQVSRLAWLHGHAGDAAELLDRVLADRPDHAAVWVHVWQESPEALDIVNVYGAELVGVKIPASSELIGVYVIAPADPLPADTLVDSFQPLSEADTWGLRQVPITIPADLHAQARDELDRLPEWADHYSSYNRGHAWSAIALRGYTDDPACIVKPAEMSKAWRAEHAELLTAEVRDTPVRALLPAVDRLARLVPGVHQRVRLMRLLPGGGELTRHADITDPEAGTADRHLLRIHLPLVTNPDVVFSSWDLTGRRYTRTMAAGEAWYLDTRKPHTAVNGGATDRIHLVVDTYSSPELLRLLAASS